MDPQWKTYHYRMQSLEKDLAGHDSRFNEFGARNDTHSAKLRTLERQLEDLKFDNSRLYMIKKKCFTELRSTLQYN
jgi:hypothetical protein